jgi:hypothetical protein
MPSSNKINEKKVKDLILMLKDRPGFGEAAESEIYGVGLANAAKIVTQRAINEAVPILVAQTGMVRDKRIAKALTDNTTEEISALIQKGAKGGMYEWEDITHVIGTPAAYRRIMNGKMMQFWTTLVLAYYLDLDPSEFATESKFELENLVLYCDLAIATPTAEGDAGFTFHEIKTSIGVDYQREVLRHNDIPFFLICLGHDLGYSKVEFMLAHKCQPVYFIERKPVPQPHRGPHMLVHPGAISITDLVASLKVARAQKVKPKATSA